MNRFKAIFFLLTFCSSVLGYSLELHYCHDEITDISLFGDTECVCPETEMAHEPVEKSCSEGCHHPASAVQKNVDSAEDAGCCKTEQLTFLSPGDKALSGHAAQQPELALMEILNPYRFVASPEPAAHTGLHYSPPLLSRDITVLVRTFLI